MRRPNPTSLLLQRPFDELRRRTLESGHGMDAIRQARPSPGAMLLDVAHNPGRPHAFELTQQIHMALNEMATEPDSQRRVALRILRSLLQDDRQVDLFISGGGFHGVHDRLSLEGLA